MNSFTWWLVTFVVTAICVFVEIKRWKFVRQFFRYIGVNHSSDSTFRQRRRADWWFEHGASVCSLIQIFATIFLIFWLFVGAELANLRLVK